MDASPRWVGMGRTRLARREEESARKARAERWERWKTIAGWIAAIGIPLALGSGGWLISLSLKERESQTKFIELAVSILSSEPKPLDDHRALRKWAVETLSKYAAVPLPALARSGLESQLQLTGKGLRAEVGVTMTTLDSRRGPGIPTEMSFGNLVTDAMRAAFLGAQPADFALITSNSFRGKRLYEPGTKLTRLDFLAELPFSNSVTLLHLSGAQIFAAVEETANQAGSGGIPQVSGLAIKYSEEGGRIKIRSLHAAGAPLSPEKMYRVVSTDFDAAGHVRAFKDAERLKHPSVGRHVHDIVLLHMYDEKAVSSAIEGRIVKVQS